MDDEIKSPSASPAIGKKKGSEKSKNGIPAQNNHSDPCDRQPERNSCPQVGSSGERESAMDMVSGTLKSVDISGNTPNDEGIEEWISTRSIERYLVGMHYNCQHCKWISKREMVAMLQAGCNLMTRV